MAVEAVASSYISNGGVQVLLNFEVVVESQVSSQALIRFHHRHKRGLGALHGILALLRLGPKASSRRVKVESLAIQDIYHPLIATLSSLLVYKKLITL